MIIVSSCLLGLRAKYDGGRNTADLLVAHAGRGRFLPLCPEQLGGLPVPRPPAEISGGSGADVLAGRARVFGRDGSDLTAAFISGAEELRRVILTFPVTAAILKARSPSCGVSCIYDGSFSHTRIGGDGVAAAVLAALGVPLYTEETIDETRLLALLAEEESTAAARK